MDSTEINRKAWDEEVKRDNYWTRIVSEEIIESARQGMPKIMLSPEKYAPLSWLEGARDKDTLILAGGGGQQTPILAAFGAKVTTLDNSPSQIEQDRRALKKYSLNATLIVGDMNETGLPSSSFDYVINPVSLNFIEDIERVYREVHRLLRDNGTFLFGIANPILYTINEQRYLKRRRLQIKYTLPYSDEGSLSKREYQKRVKGLDTVEFSHTLDKIIGGLLKSGFIIRDFYSDGSATEPLDSFFYDCYLVFRAEKLSNSTIL